MKEMDKDDTFTEEESVEQQLVQKNLKCFKKNVALRLGKFS